MVGNGLWAMCCSFGQFFRYSDNSKELDRQLTNWLNAAGTNIGAARAIITPHAGYAYCGETAGLLLP